ncbi:MAG: response regulator transcription factor [Acetobacteraceae bacterium]
MVDTILLVDDDPGFAEELCAFLEQHDFTCHAVTDPALALSRLQELEPDLLLLDQRMGAISGVDVLRSVRERSNVPCIILTGVTDPIDRILGLELGADDYVHKTAMPREVVARIRAVLRRLRLAQAHVPAPDMARVPADPVTRSWDLRQTERELYRPDGSRCHLSTAEFVLLRTLAEVPGQALGREMLTETVFGRPYRPGDRAIDSVVVRLRRKLEPDAEHPIVIKSARQTGYLFAGFPPYP